MYCELIVEAGNETTRNAISGGLLAFSEHRGEWEKLRDRPELLPDAVEEMLRWVSPIIHFTRMATEDAEVHGVKIRRGRPRRAVLRVGEPRRRRVRATRSSSASIATRIRSSRSASAEHFCMGAHLARLEMETVFRHLLTRLESFEVTGPVERLNSAVNGGIKHLPLRCRLA